MPRTYRTRIAAAAVAIAAAVSAFGGSTFVETAGPQRAPESAEYKEADPSPQPTPGPQTQSARWN